MSKALGCKSLTHFRSSLKKAPIIYVKQNLFAKLSFAYALTKLAEDVSR